MFEVIVDRDNSMTASLDIIAKFFKLRYEAVERIQRETVNGRTCTIHFNDRPQFGLTSITVRRAS